MLGTSGVGNHLVLLGVSLVQMWAASLGLLESPLRLSLLVCLLLAEGLHWEPNPMSVRLHWEPNIIGACEALELRVFGLCEPA